MNRFKPDQIKRASENVKYIMQKGNFTSDDLTSGQGTGGISKNTYLKLTRYDPNKDKEWCPQEKTLINFITFVNQNFYHQISLHDLIHTSLNDIEFTRIAHRKWLDWYTGLYYCYYHRSEGDTVERKYGLIKISQNADQYICQAILGMKQEKFNNLGDISNIQSLVSLHDNSENPFEFFYDGTLFLQSESIIVHLIPRTNTFTKILVIKRQDENSLFRSYLGDIIGMVTTTHTASPTKYQQLAISKNKLKNDSDVDNFLVLNNHNDLVVKTKRKITIRGLI